MALVLLLVVVLVSTRGRAAWLVRTSASSMHRYALKLMELALSPGTKLLTNFNPKTTDGNQL